MDKIQQVTEQQFLISQIYCNKLFLQKRYPSYICKSTLLFEIRKTIYITEGDILSFSRLSLSPRHVLTITIAGQAAVIQRRAQK